MCSCPKCGRRPIKRKLNVRQCRHCGILPEPVIGGLNSQHASGALPPVDAEQRA